MGDISWARRFYWSVRREMWESPSIYVAPLAAAVVVVLGFLVAAIRVGSHGSAQQSILLATLIKQPYDFAIGLIMLSAYAVAIFYCLDTLYGERRDRTILFWKSLPVSDVTTMVAKLSIPFLIIPLVCFAVTVVTLVLMTLVGSAVFAVSGVNTSAVITHPPLLRMSLLLLYHLFTVHALWWAPFFGWLLLISAWSRRAPLVWAVVPLLAIAMVERIAFNSSHFAGMLQWRFNLSPEAVVSKGTMPIDPMTQLTPGLFLSSPGLWIGLGITVAFVAVAVRLRRDRGPI
jgi:ABC-2 type transport system permease protein